MDRYQRYATATWTFGAVPLGSAFDTMARISRFAPGLGLPSDDG